MDQSLINALVYTTVSIVLYFLLILDVITFIINRKIEYGIGALLWTIMIYTFL